MIYDACFLHDHLTLLFGTVCADKARKFSHYARDFWA